MAIIIFIVLTLLVLGGFTVPVAAMIRGGGYDIFSFILLAVLGGSTVLVIAIGTIIIS